jgi:hypothetical protein
MEFTLNEKILSSIETIVGYYYFGDEEEHFLRKMYDKGTVSLEEFKDECECHIFHDFLVLNFLGNHDFIDAYITNLWKERYDNEKMCDDDDDDDDDDSGRLEEKN